MLLGSQDSASSVKAAHEKALRAGERVLQYLLAEFDRPHLKGGSRLPTNKELAERLRVSQGTVQTVLRQLARQGRIQSRRGSGTYFMSSPEKSPRNLRIGVGASLRKLNDADGWMSRFGGGAFHAALKEQVVLEGISDCENDAMVEELLDKRGKLDALILLPYTAAFQSERLREAYESSGKPVVHLYPPSITATANFVSTDFFGSSYHLGKTWRMTGRRRILILCNNGSRHGDMRLAVSTQLRQAGLTCGLGLSSEDSMTLHICEVSSPGATEEGGYEAMRRIAKSSGLLPDAIYCSGDRIALGVCQALMEMGGSVPESVSVVGASGLNLARTGCPDLTRVHSELERVGAMAVEMILQRLRLDVISLPGVIVPTSFVGGATTRVQENDVLANLTETKFVAPLPSRQ